MTSTGETFNAIGSSSPSLDAAHSDDDWNAAYAIDANDGASATDTANCANITAATFDSGDQSYILTAQNYDFTGIPDGATINGITCRINAWYQNGSGSIDYLKLLDSGGNPTGTNQCSTAVTLTTTSSTVITKGSSADVWGVAADTTLVKNGNFGIALGVLSTAANTDAFVDYITLEIDYTAGSTAKTLTDTGAGAEASLPFAKETYFPPFVVCAPIARYYE